VILFIGRHEPRKGLSVLLDAFERIRTDIAAPFPVLWVLGDGPQTEALRLSAGVDVEWLGSVSEAEKASRLRAATVACFPSIEGESFGVVLLEAMAAGAPIVASDLTGYRNVVRDGREALLVEPGNEVALAGALQRLLTDAALRDTLTTGGHRRAAEFSMQRLAESFVERYESAMGASRGGGGRRRDGLLPVGNL
jgi:phosphatidylinositol alpha-mannosyltransferase